MRHISKKLGRAAFAIPELLVIIFVLAILIGPRMFATARADRRFITQDLNNLRLILNASALYSAENDDRLAHPSWGSDLTGPDNWAYLTSNRDGKVKGALSFAPGSCAGVDVNSRQFTNQLAFFKAGQVTQYLPDVKTAWCPKDVATRGSGQLKSLWFARPIKVTSYCWNATIGGYVGKPGDLAGKTYKTTAFLPTDIQIWEANEADSFNFNDAACNPENPSEGVSRRHSGRGLWWQQPLDSKSSRGAAMAGSFDGSAEIVQIDTMAKLATRDIPAPNRLLNGPDYRE